jgi:hypothetical protein
MRIISSPLSSAIGSALHTVIDPFVGGAPFNPNSLFGAGDGGGVIDCGDLALCLFQDPDGLVPVTAEGQQVQSVRARNRPSFLMVWRDGSLPVTYELDPQGFPALKAALGDNTGWAYFEKEDGGVPVADFSIVLAAMGAYGPGQVGVGTGWTVVGDANATEIPYSYAGVYTVVAGDAAELTVNIDYSSPGTSFPIVENLDAVPYVFSSRVSDGDSRLQINLEPVIDDPSPLMEAAVPVGIRFWISPGDYWYGGVFITRDLSDPENYDTQVWCGGLAGITLGPAPPPFNPMDLFLPGDLGGFYNTSNIASLFQTRTGPTVPVTGNGDPVQFAVSQNGQFALARSLTAANPGFLYQNGLLEAPVGSAQFASLNSGNVPGFGQVTVVMAGVIDTPLPVETNITAMGFDVDNTTAFGGANIAILLRSNPTLRLLNWVPPGSSPSVTMAIPEAELTSPFVFGYRQDEASPTQYMFFNDNESTPTIEYAPVTAQASAAEYIGFAGSATDPPVQVFNGSAFFINRLLTDTELARLKVWMRANTPTP